jgi:predicted nucleic acid-binding protein
MNSLDTNILVYAVSTGNGVRENTAREVVQRASMAGWPIAAQVYGEFFAVMTRRQLMTRLQALTAIKTFSALMPQLPSTVAAHNIALKLAAEKQVQIWDALIVAVCAENGVTQLFTEDIPSATKHLGVKYVSPFATK